MTMAPAWRSVVAWTVLLGLLIAGFTVPTRDAAAQSGPIVFKLGHALAPTHPFHLGMTRTAEVIAERTKGAVKIEVFPSSQLGTDRDRIASIKTGGHDMDLQAPGGASVLLPELGVIDAPYLFRDDAHWRAVVKSSIVREWNERLVKEQGVRIVGWFFKGIRHVTTRNRPVNTINDIRGMKIRVADFPPFPQVYRAFGATPTPIAFAEMYQALATGTVDGADIPSESMLHQKLSEVSRYLNLIAWSYAAPGVVLVNERKYQIFLSADQKRIMAEAVEEGTELIFRLMRDGEADTLKKIEATGVRLVKPTDLPEWRKRALEVAVPELARTWGGDASLYSRLSAIK
jgi:tripartite ATP-independent transporter DctP family solute receptor